VEWGDDPARGGMLAARCAAALGRALDDAQDEAEKSWRRLRWGAVQVANPVVTTQSALKPPGFGNPCACTV
jgi:hypothetical protein